MKSSPIYNRLQHYLIEHACFWIFLTLLYLPQAKFGGYIGNTLSVRPSVHPSMYLVSATPPKWLIGILWNFTHLLYTTCICAWRNMDAVQNSKGEIIQLILSREGGMYLVSATPTKLLIEFLWNFTQLYYTTGWCAWRNTIAVQNLKREISQLIVSWEKGAFTL